MSGQRGSASVLGVAIVAVAIVVGAGVVAVSGLATDRAAARSAADLAALAGAFEVRRGLGGRVETDRTGADPCAVARRTARENEATVTRCQVFGDGSVQVTVASGHSSASARAGPRNIEGPGGDSG